jgi:hypothetical protein
MLVIVISWIVDVDGVDILGCRHRWQFKPILSPIYRFLGRYTNTSGFDNQCIPIVVIIDGINTSTTAIVSMSMSQLMTSMTPSTADDDSIDDVSMADL